MPALAIVPSSSNGLVEYRAATFGGALRGSLLLQKWNGKTMSLRLSADQTSVEEISDLPTSMESLDLTTGPGGALIGADLTDHRIVIARPIEARDGPMAVYDVHPWRGTVEGGFRFVLGGRRLASAQAPVVRFGDVVAQVTSASPTRIEGVVPGRSDVPPGPVDITVSTGSETKVLPDAFRYLPARGEARGGACRITIDSGGSLPGSSTYSSGSFRIENLSSNGQHIERVRFDLRSALLRDLAFDPDGLAGDRVGKDLTIDSPGEVQVAGHAFLQPRSGGYDVLEIEFSSFPPGAVLRFSVDIDPTSIRGEPAPGPGASGSVSGLELAGAAVEVTLDDRVLLRGETFPTSGSLTGSTVLLNGTTLSRPLVDLLGAQSVADPQEVLRVHAPAGTEIRLLVAEAGRFVGEQGGFDLQPDETNSLLAVTEHAATVSEAGYVDLPVSLTRSAPEGGWNVITAVARSEGATSRLAPTRVVRLAPSP
jgi:hypothetical protein